MYSFFNELRTYNGCLMKSVNAVVSINNYYRSLMYCLLTCFMNCLCIVKLDSLFS